MVHSAWCMVYTGMAGVHGADLWFCGRVGPCFVDICVHGAWCIRTSCHCGRPEKLGIVKGAECMAHSVLCMVYLATLYMTLTCECAAAESAWCIAGAWCILHISICMVNMGMVCMAQAYECMVRGSWCIWTWRA